MTDKEEALQTWANGIPKKLSLPRKILIKLLYPIVYGLLNLYLKLAKNSIAGSWYYTWDDKGKFRMKPFRVFIEEPNLEDWEDDSDKR